MIAKEESMGVHMKKKMMETNVVEATTARLVSGYR